MSQNHFCYIIKHIVTKKRYVGYKIHSKSAGSFNPCAILSSKRDLLCLNSSIFETNSLQVGIPQICIIQIGRDGEEHFQYKEIDPGRNTTPLLLHCFDQVTRPQYQIWLRLGLLSHHYKYLKELEDKASLADTEFTKIMRLIPNPPLST